MSETMRTPQPPAKPAPVRPAVPRNLAVLLARIALRISTQTTPTANVTK